MKLDEISQANAAVKAELMETNQSLQNIKNATADLAEKCFDMKEIIGMTNCGELLLKVDNWAEISKNRIGQSIYSERFIRCSV